MNSFLRLMIVVIVLVLPVLLFSQKNQVSIENNKSKREVEIKVGGKPFTTYIYTDTMEKPFLYPIYAPNQQTITRGYPWKPEPNDPVDHPHHIGLWFNYEYVNGLDFWNNSFAIAADKKANYGWIRTVGVTNVYIGKAGGFSTEANWTNQKGEILLKENTDYTFSEENGYRVIIRATRLTAETTVNFNDVKDGMLGLRVAHQLELPVKQTKQYTDASGIVTTVTASKDSTVTGNYLTATGKQGDDAWGTRANWCMLYGKKGGEEISIVMIDHRENPGYPTYWHARNYGLFAANPLGQKVFSNGKETLNFKLEKGQSATFRYKIIIASGKEKLSPVLLDKVAADFGG